MVLLYYDACVVGTANEGGQQKEAPGWNGEKWKKNHLNGKGWLRVAEMGDSSQKSRVEIPLHYGLLWKLKNPWEWAKGKRRKTCECMFTPLEQLRLTCEGPCGPLIIQLLERTTPGQSLPPFPPHTVGKITRGCWYVPPGLVPVRSQSMVGGPSHVFHRGKY